MTNKRRKRHSPEQIVRKIQEADRILAEGGDVVAVLRQLNVTEATDLPPVLGPVAVRIVTGFTGDSV